MVRNLERGAQRDARLRRDGAAPVGVQRDPVEPVGLHRYPFVLEGVDAGAGVTLVELSHGGVSTHDIGIPIPTNMSSGPVAVSMLVNGAPVGDPWVLTIQVREPGSDVYADVATFEVAD